MPDLLSQNIDIVQKNLSLRSWSSIVFRVGSTYYARKFDGTLISSSTAAETVIQAAIDLGGHILISGTSGVSTVATDSSPGVDYIMSGSFSGLNFTNHRVCVEIQQGAYIVVPSGYTGYVFRSLEKGYNEICGFGHLFEATPKSFLWTGVKLESSGSIGATFCTVRDIDISGPGVAIELKTTGTGFVNGNNFIDIRSDQLIKGVVFNRGGGEISNNTFIGLQFEGDGSETNGVQDIQDDGNTFINCVMWDFATTATEANIKSTANGTVIIGGRMTGQGNFGKFIDQGQGTIILNPFRNGGQFSTIIPRPDVVKYGAWHGVASTGADGLLDSRLAQGVVGTASASSTIDSTGQYTTFDTGATINSIMAHRITGALPMRRILNAYFKAAIYLNSVSNVRIYCGLVDQAANPASSSDPLNAKNGVALWLDSGVSANWKIAHNDGTGATVVDDTSVSAATSTLYPVEIYAVNDSKFRFVFNGTSTDVTADIPASTTNLGFWTYIENTTGASRTMRVYYEIIRSDK